MREASDKKPPLHRVLQGAERLLYYAAALALLITVGFFFVSTALEIPILLTEGAFYTGGASYIAVAVLDRVLLVFIFAELLHGIRVIVQEDRIAAEPFLVIGIIAVIRRVLLVSAEATRLSDSVEAFQRLLLEMGVLSALVIALGVSFYLVKRVSQQEEGKANGPHDHGTS